jgi:hypothetical protein
MLPEPRRRATVVRAGRVVMQEETDVDDDHVPPTKHALDGVPTRMLVDGE